MRRVRRTKRRCRAGLPWTSQEEELLTELHPTCNNRDLAVRLGRSEWAISGKARALGLTRDLGGGYRRRRSEGGSWSHREIELLRQLYPIMPYEEVAEKLGRSHDAVKMKARRLQLRKIEFWSEQEDQLLRDCYQEQSYDHVARRLGRTLRAVRARAITLGLKAKVPNWTEDEIRFLRNSYGVTDLNGIAKVLRRTRAATAKKARELELVQWRHWSAEETQRLAELYPHCTTRELADRLWRSCRSIRYKASRLGLRKQSQLVESSKISSQRR
jgi:DNA-binding CsgD family transcriptional regulator